MAKRIALVVLTLALVGTWGVLPAMAYDCPWAVKLLKDVFVQCPDTPAVAEEARKPLVDARHGEAKGKVDGVWKAKTAQELAAEIAARSTP